MDKAKVFDDIGLDDVCVSLKDRPELLVCGAFLDVANKELLAGLPANESGWRLFPPNFPFMSFNLPDLGPLLSLFSTLSVLPFTDVPFNSVTAADAESSLDMWTKLKEMNKQ